MNHQLVYYPDPILRAKSRPVTTFTPEILELGEKMRHIMQIHNGMGLAAPQVGDSRRIIVVEFPGDSEGKGAIPFTVLVNPKIVTQSSATDTMNEGCLSIPYVEVSIARSVEIIVTAQTPSGEPVKFKAKGLYARILQHEIDHLDGKLILDYDKKPNLKNRLPRVVVWGSTQFTIGVLNTIRPTTQVTHIVTEPAKPSGRDLKLTPTVVKTYADTLGIETLEPRDLQDPHVYSYLLSCKPDVMIVAAYGRLIPEKLFTLPVHGTLNVHPSLLPKYRGATPIQSAILAGDKKTGVTIMKLAPRFDTGEIVAQAPYTLEGNETYGDLEYMLAELGGEMLNQILKPYLNDEIVIEMQNELNASSTHKITTEDRWLDMSASPDLNYRKILAYAPEPGAFVIIDSTKVKICSAHLKDDALLFDMVQPAGKKPMTWKDFLNGHRGKLNFEPYVNPK